MVHIARELDLLLAETACVESWVELHEMGVLRVLAWIDWRYPAY